MASAFIVMTLTIIMEQLRRSGCQAMNFSSANSRRQVPTAGSLYFGWFTSAPSELTCHACSSLRWDVPSAGCGALDWGVVDDRDRSGQSAQDSQ